MEIDTARLLARRYLGLMLVSETKLVIRPDVLSSEANLSSFSSLGIACTMPWSSTA